MKIPDIRKYCTPALVYFTISMVAIVILFIQNMRDLKSYCLANIECDTYTVILIYIVKVIYVLFWTWLLNLICKSGASWVSWLLVLFPFILFFIILLFFFFV